MAEASGFSFFAQGNMTMADGAPLSVGSRVLVCGDAYPKAERQVTPAKAIAASRSRIVPFLMCLSLCITKDPKIGTNPAHAENSVSLKC